MASADPGRGYISGLVIDAKPLYGSFAAVVGLLIWMALLARVLLYAGEVNVVVSKRLWPRSLTGRKLTEADEQSFDEISSREIRRAGDAH